MSVSIFDCMVLSEYTDGSSYKRSYAIPTVFSRDESQKKWLSVESALRPEWD